MRDWLNNNPAVVTVAAVALLLVALFVLFRQVSGPAIPQSMAYFKDVRTGEVFSASAMELPPIQSRAGNPAVRVVMFSCGDCTEEEMFEGYYERYSDEGKRLMQRLLELDDDEFAEDDDPGMIEEEHMYVADSLEGPWYTHMSNRAIEIMDVMCNGNFARPCMPQ